MNSVNATNVVQLLTLLLSSGALTLLIYQLRSLGLPDKAVPIVAHVSAVLVAILIALFDSMATGKPLTADVVIAAILAGITGALAASGIHGQTKVYKPSPQSPPLPVLPPTIHVQLHQAAPVVSHPKTPPAPKPAEPAPPKP